MPASRRNISEGGIFIATEAPLFLGDRINLSVSFGDTAVTAEAEVMWLRRSAQTGLPDGMGLRFVGSTPGQPRPSTASSPATGRTCSSTRFSEAASREEAVLSLQWYDVDGSFIGAVMPLVRSGRSVLFPLVAAALLAAVPASVGCSVRGQSRSASGPDTQGEPWPRPTRCSDSRPGRDPRARLEAVSTALEQTREVLRGVQQELRDRRPDWIRHRASGGPARGWQGPARDFTDDTCASSAVGTAHLAPAAPELSEACPL